MEDGFCKVSRRVGSRSMGKVVYGNSFTDSCGSMLEMSCVWL